MRSLMKHQKAAISFVSKKLYAGFIMGVGTGKTLTAIRWAQDKLPVIVLCRRDDFMTWSEELSMEGEGDVLFINKQAVKMDDLPRWTILTHDMVRNKNIRIWIKAQKFKTIIIDESQKIKRWKAKRTKVIIRSTQHIPFRAILTGTLITNQIEDVFSQMLFLDGGKRFGTSHYRFMQMYYSKMPWGGWEPKAKAKRKIIDRLKGSCYIIESDEVLDLPPTMRVIKSAPMRVRQARLYKEMLNEFEANLRTGRRIEVNYVVTQIAKLQQIASGFVYDGHPNVPVWFPSGKMDLLERMLTDPDDLGLKNKIVIWCKFTAEIIRIESLAIKLEVDSKKFYGGMSLAERNTARKEFAADPNERMLFIGQVEAGVGMNELTVADTAIYFSNSTKVEARKQSEGRIRRKGSEHHKRIVYYDLVSEGTIDEKIRSALKKKINFERHFIRTLRTSMGEA